MKDLVEGHPGIDIDDAKLFLRWRRNVFRAPNCGRLSKLLLGQLYQQQLCRALARPIGYCEPLDPPS